MDAEAACILCNWANNVLWPYFGLGALGAGAAAAAAAGGFFGGGGYSSGGADGDGGQDDSGADQTQSQSDYDNSLIKPPRRGQTWPETGRDTRDAFHYQQFGPREDSWYNDRLLDASEAAQRWAQDMLGLDPNNPEGKGTAPTAHLM